MKQAGERPLQIWLDQSREPVLLKLENHTEFWVNLPTASVQDQCLPVNSRCGNMLYSWEFFTGQGMCLNWTLLGLADQVRSDRAIENWLLSHIFLLHFASVLLFICIYTSVPAWYSLKRSAIYSSRNMS